MTFQPLIPTVLTPVAVSVLTDPATGILAVAEALQPDLAQGFQIDALRLRLEMERAFGGSDAMGAWDWKLAYEAGEVALVLFLRKFGRALLARAGSLAAVMPILAKVSGLLPTHTRRSEEMERFQQFSTPLPMGLAALAAAKITHADLVLEPSAGTGLLAILAEIAGGALALNELAETRADLLRLLFPGRPVARFDAAQIDDHLDAGLRPSVILMNPPFSAVANVEGRTAFESAKQRFFGHLLTSMKTPTLIASIAADLVAGHSAVIQIVSTGEALMERRLSDIPTEEWNDIRVDITPREYVLSGVPDKT